MKTQISDTLKADINLLQIVTLVGQAGLTVFQAFNDAQEKLIEANNAKHDANDEAADFEERLNDVLSQLADSRNNAVTLEARIDMLKLEIEEAQKNNHDYVRYTMYVDSAPEPRRVMTFVKWKSQQ